MSDVVFSITAKDDASVVFNRIGDSAQKMARDASQSLEKIGNSASASFAKMASSMAVGQIGAMAFSKALDFASSSVTEFFKTNSDFEKYNLQFKILLGSADLASKRMEELAKFGAETPFEVDGIAKASKILQTFGGTALATGEGLRMVGDSAAMAGVPIEELSIWIGRAYDGLKNGKPIGEASARLQELALISGETRNKIEELNATGRNKEAWDTLQKSLDKNKGTMAELSKTSEGLFSTLKDSYAQVLRDLDKNAEITKYAKEAMIGLTESFGKMSQWMIENKSTLENFGALLFDVAVNFKDVAFFVGKVVTDLALFATSGGGAVVLASGGVALLVANIGKLQLALNSLAFNPIIASAIAVGLVTQLAISKVEKAYQKTIDMAEKNADYSSKVTKEEAQAVDKKIMALRELEKADIGATEYKIQSSKLIAELEDATGKQFSKNAIKRAQEMDAILKFNAVIEKAPNKAKSDAKSLSDSIADKTPKLKGANGKKAKTPEEIKAARIKEELEKKVQDEKNFAEQIAMWQNREQMQAQAIGKTMTKEAEQEAQRQKDFEAEKLRMQILDEAKMDSVSRSLSNATQLTAMLGEQNAIAKTAAIAEIGFNTSRAVMKTLADPSLPAPLNMIEAVSIGALGAAQAAKVAGIFEKGGPVYGARHSGGGVKAELEGGEFVLSRNDVRNFGGMGAVERMRKGASGGFNMGGFSPTIHISNQGGTLSGEAVISAIKSSMPQFTKMIQNQQRRGFAV